MSSPSPSPYTPLLTHTTIRVLLLAPGDPDDAIHCWLLPCDLDADHAKFPHTTERPFTWNYPFPCPTSAGHCQHENREYKLEIDCILSPRDDGLVALPQHPFQRYTALSYVWGSAEDPLEIILNGEVRFPVTRNLHAALHTLRTRCDWSGRVLWVDAVCINQRDHAEKEGQLPLMQRVYRQAEEVVAYLPMVVEDQLNLAELLGKIQEAYNLYQEDMDTRGMTDAMEASAGEHEGKREELADSTKDGSPSSPPSPDGTTVMTSSAAPTPLVHQQDLGITFWDAFALAQQQAREYNKARPSARFIEDFGLPPTNSTLWTSWRRLFASPYFRRIWILQEFALAQKLTLQLGERVSFDVAALVMARHYLQSSSGIKNASYLGHSAPGDSPELTTDAIAGVNGLDVMIVERARCQVWGQAGDGEGGGEGEGVGDDGGGDENDDGQREGQEEDGTVEEAGARVKGKIERPGDEMGNGRLVEKIAAARGFKATDERDKLYAVMGLAVDGGDPAWKELVSYAPGVTAGEVYTRFARAMVERGEGFEVLLQAGITGGGLDIPTWVPDWSDEICPSGAPKRDVPSSAMGIQVSDDNVILIPGTVVDEIQIVSETPFLNQGARTTPGMKRNEFDHALWGGAIVALGSRITRDPGLEGDALLTQVFDGLYKVATEGDDLFDVLAQEDDPDTRASLRKGFDSYMKMCRETLPFCTQQPPEYVPIDSPQEMHKFMDQAARNVWSARLCATKIGRIGLVPERTEIGDKVAVFEGCDVAFVLRAGGGGEVAMHHKLVGHAYFCRKKGEWRAYDATGEGTETIQLT